MAGRLAWEANENYLISYRVLSEGEEIRDFMKKYKNSFQQEYYEEYYAGIHYKGTLGAFTNYYHRKLEKFGNVKDLNGKKYLEIGAGSGEHLQFVDWKKVERYVLLDLDFEETIIEKLNQKYSKLEFIIAPAENIPLPDESFDVINVTCVMNHLNDPASALNEFKRLLKSGGVLVIYMPCDPGMIYRWIRHVTSHRKQAKTMSISMAETKFLWSQEHRNHFPGLQAQIKWIFKECELKTKAYPFRFLSWNLNLFKIVRVRKS